MLVEIGRILKPRGLKGELKVEILYNRPNIFSALENVTIAGRSYVVQKSSVQNRFAYLMLHSIDTIEKAENLRGQTVAVEDSILDLSDDEILSTDLIGYNVEQNEKVIGKVTAVENYGAGDFFEIALTGAGYVAIPNEDEFIAETNVTLRKLVLTPTALQSELV